MTARDSLPDVSLTAQIHVVEQRLLRRRQASAVHAASFKSHLLARLTSPFAFIAATAAGFAIERWYSRRNERQSAAAGTDQGISLTSLLPFITLGASMIEWAQVTLARSRGAEDTGSGGNRAGST